MIYRILVTDTGINLAYIRDVNYIYAFPVRDGVDYIIV